MDRLEKMNVEFYKIGSGECNNYPLVEYIAEKKPIILSTGMNDISSVKPAVKIIEDNKIPYVLMHTTNLYPTPYHLVRLGALKDSSKNFPNALIGLSDHTDNNYACLAAVALGACVIEKHFTDNHKRNGPDISCSMDINDTKNLINGSKIIFQESGGQKNIISEEKLLQTLLMQQLIVTIKSINKGEKFTKDNLWVKRPGTGEIRANRFNELLEKSNKNLKINSHLKNSDIENN